MAASDKIIETICPSCNFNCRLSVAYIGKKTTCQSCNHSFETAKFSAAGLLHNFYKIAIKNELISEEMFEEIFSEHKSAKKLGQTFSIEDAFIEKGLITSDQKNRLMMASLRKLNIKFINMAVERSLISREEGEIVLFRQSEDFKQDKLTLVGDILIGSDLIDQGQQESLLAEIQKGRSAKENRKEKQYKSMEPPFMGKVALKKEIINKKELERALTIFEKQEKEAAQKSFEDILFEAEVISRDMKDKLILKTLKQLDKKLGEIAIERGFVTKEDVKLAASEQASAFKKFNYKPLLTFLLANEKITEKQSRLIQKGFKEVDTKEAESWVKKAKIALSRIAIERKISKIDTSVKGRKKLRSGISPQPKKQEKAELPEVDRVHLDGEQVPEISSGEDGPEISLSFSPDQQFAYIALSSSLGEDIFEAMDEWVRDIKSVVSDNDIIFGMIPDDLIKENIRSAVLKKKPFKVAEGKPSVEGKEAEIIFHFETNYLKPGVVTADGMIDYRDRGDIPYAKKGELLAELIPCVPGKNGSDVFGNIIEVPEVKNLELKCGNGAVISEDKLRIFADVDGRPDLAINGTLSVFPEMTVQGDINFETGNVEFNGNILVKGTICEGFKVKGVNITAQNINGGEIEATGDIDVSGGIVDSNIIADGYVQAMYIKGANIDIYGDLLIVKEIIDSKIWLSGMCRSDRCKVINSSISSKMGMEIYQVGTDVSKPCHLRVGLNDHIDRIIGVKKERFKETKSRLENTQIQMEEYLEKLRDEHQKIIEITMLQESLENELQQLSEIVDKNRAAMNGGELNRIHVEIQENELQLKESEGILEKSFASHDKLLNALLFKLAAIERNVHEIEDVNESISILKDKRDKETGKAFIKVQNKIYAKTMVFGKHSSVILKEDLKNVNITEMRIIDPEKKSPPRWEMETKKLK